MVEIWHYSSDAASLASRRTPPYAPPLRPSKRPLSRNGSPASRASSVHPAETTSPARKVIKVFYPDDIEVVELQESDARVYGAVDLVYPEDSEEPSSENDEDEEDEEECCDKKVMNENDNNDDDEDDEEDDTDEEDDDEDEDDEDEDEDEDADVEDSDDDDDSSSDTGDLDTQRLAREFKGLYCSPQQQLRFDQARQKRHRDLRRDSRVGKRSHSISAKSESGNVDSDAMDDHDCPVTQRRLRRRTRGPGDLDFDFEQLQKASFMYGTPAALHMRASVLVTAEEYRAY